MSKSLDTVGRAELISNVINKAAAAAITAVSHFGVASQRAMAVEEMGELLAAMSHCERGRASPDDVVAEVADVILTALQVAHIYGGGSYTSLSTALQAKTKRLGELIASTPPSDPEPESLRWVRRVKALEARLDGVRTATNET